MSAPVATDLLLLHPPSVHDFRQESILYGPISDKSELTWPRHTINFHPLEILRRALAMRRRERSECLTDTWRELHLIAIACADRR